MQHLKSICALVIYEWIYQRELLLSVKTKGRHLSLCTRKRGSLKREWTPAALPLPSSFFLWVGLEQSHQHHHLKVAKQSQDVGSIVITIMVHTGVCASWIRKRTHILLWWLWYYLSIFRPLNLFRLRLLQPVSVRFMPIWRTLICFSSSICKCLCLYHFVPIT